MFGKKRNKLYVTLTIDDSVDIRAVRDFLINVVLKKLTFIKHASASFGTFSNNVVAEDYETSRAYAGIAVEAVDRTINENELKTLRQKINDLQEEVEERSALSGN